MGIVDYVVLLLMVFIAVELVLEVRKKRWWGAAISAAILAFMVWNWSPLLVHVWKMVTP